MPEADSAFGIVVIGIPNPLQPHDTITATFPVGSSLLDIVGGGHSHVWIEVGGAPIPREQWAHVRPHPWATVVVRAQPAGPLIGVAIAVASSTLAAGVGAAVTGAALGAALITGAATGLAMGVLSLALNALFPAQKPSGGIKVTQRPAWAGVQNEITPYGPIPRLYGKFRSFPIVVGKPFTEVVGPDQYLHCLFTPGFGPLHLSDLKIGDTSLDQFQGCTVVVSGPAGTTFDQSYGGRVTAGSVFSLYGETVDEQFLTIGFDEPTDEGVMPAPVIRTTAPNTTRITLDLTWPSGLYSVNNKGKKMGGRSRYRIEYSPRNANSWTNVHAANPTISGGAENGSGGTLWDTDFYDTGAKSSTTVRLGFGWNVPAGQYDVRVTYLGYDDSGHTAVPCPFTWTALRSWKPGKPVSQEVVDKAVLVAVKIKATDQTQTLDKVNFVAEAKLPVWNGTTWSAPQITRNPAWAAADALIGTANARAAEDSALDLSAFLAFAADCDARGFEYNDPGLDQISVLDRFRAICNSAAGDWIFDDLGIGVIRDAPATTPVQLFTPRNTSGFKSTKTFVDLPHAFKVPFFNPANDWQQDYAFAYQDGYSLDGAGGTTAATKFETLDYRGATSHGQAWKFGRYHIAQAILRPEVFTLETERENIVSRRGDVVAATHDIALWGLGFGRVAAVAGNVLTLDEPIQADGSALEVRIRKVDGTVVTRGIGSPAAGPRSTVTLSSPVAGLEGGELISYGYNGQSGALLKVASIVPSGPLKARLTLVDAAPDIWDAITGDIPEYNPGVTPRQRTPAAPVITAIRSDEAVAHHNADGSLSPRIEVSFSYPSSALPGVLVEGQILPEPDTDDPDVAAVWGPTQRSPIPPNVISLAGGEVGETYSVRIRVVAKDGTPSAWSSATHIVAGDTRIPDKPTGLTGDLAPDGRSVTLRWNPADYPRHSYTEVWEAADSGFTTGTLAGDASGAEYRVTTDPGMSLYFRVRFVSQSLVAGPWSDPLQVTTPATVAFLLDQLQGQVAESQLARDLASRIIPITATRTFTFASTSDLSYWTRESGTRTLGLATVAGSFGAQVASASSGANSIWTGGDFIPFDPARLYKVRFRLQWAAGTHFYLGWRGYDAAKNPVGVAAAATDGYGYYHAGNDVTGPAGTWNELVGYTQGVGASAGTGGVGLLAAPGKMHPSVRFVKPCIVQVSSVGNEAIYIDLVEVSTGDVDQANASIVAEQVAREDGDTALASNITLLTTTVDGHTASIETIQTSLNGVEAEYAVKLDVNGHVIGFGLINDGTTSSGFFVRADKFVIGLPGTGGAPDTFPFIVADGKVWIDIALIRDLTSDHISVGMGGSGGNLVPNGGAEEGGIAGWKSGSNPSGGVFEQYSGVYTAGGYSFHVTCGNYSNQTVYSRVIPVTPGKTYAVRGKFNVNGTITAGMLNFTGMPASDPPPYGSWPGISQLLSRTDTSTSWGELDVEWTPSAGTVFSCFYVALSDPSGGGAAVFFDEIALIPQVDTTEITPQGITTPKIKAREIIADRLIFNGVTYDELASGAATNLKSSYLAGQQIVTSETDTQVRSVAITTIGQQVSVDFSFSCDTATGAWSDAFNTMTFSLYRDGTRIFGPYDLVLAATGGITIPTPISMALADTPAAGAHTYSLRITTAKVSKVFLRAMEARR